MVTGMSEEMNKQVKKELTQQVITEQNVTSQGSLTAAPRQAEVSAAGMEADKFTEELLATAAVKGEFMSYRDKVLAFIDKKDEETIEEHRPVMRQLLRTGEALTEPKALPDLKEMSEKDGSIQKTVMGEYAKYFKLSDFEEISKRFASGPAEDTYAGTVTAQSLTYLQFLNHKMRLGKVFSALVSYRPDELEPEQVLLIDKFAKLLAHDMEANRLNPDASAEEQIRLMKIRIEYFTDFANDSIAVYLGRRNTETEKRIHDEEIKVKGREVDREIEYNHEDYLSEMHIMMAESKEAEMYAEAFADGSIEAKMERLVGECTKSTQSYSRSVENVRLNLEGISGQYPQLNRQVTMFADKLELMNSSLKERVSAYEKECLDYCRSCTEDCRRMQEEGDREGIASTMESIVEKYHTMYASRSLAVKVELACTRVLENIYTVLNGSYMNGGMEESTAKALTELLNVNPSKLSDMKKDKYGDIDTDALQAELKSSLVLTELIETRFTNDSFMQTPEVNTMSVNADLHDLLEVDPNLHFDVVMEYFAPTVQTEDKTKRDNPYSNEALEQTRKTCLVEIERGKQYLDQLADSEFSNDAVKQVCDLLTDKVLSVNRSFEKTNNYYKNVLEQTYEKGSAEGAEVALQGLKTMMSELRDFAKCMNYMVKQLKDFVAITKNFESVEDTELGLKAKYTPMEQLGEVLRALRGSLENSFIYTPVEDNKKLFATPEMVHGQMIELTSYMQLITAKASEIMKGRAPFEDLVKSTRVVARIRELEAGSEKFLVSDSELAALKELQSKIAKLEKQGERLGVSDMSYRTQLSELQKQYEDLSLDVRKKGALHEILMKEKLKLERSLYTASRTESAASEAIAEEDRRSRVMSVAQAIMQRDLVREQADIGDERQLKATQKKRERAMEAHQREEARAKIAEERRLAELERTEEEERRHEERMAELEARKEALLKRAREIRDNVADAFKVKDTTADYVEPATLQASERLSVYIPKNATGRLQDYTLKGKKVKGVGKLESFGSCASSKLKERMKKHTLRFLYSEKIEADGLNATADSIIKGAGFISKAYLKSKAPAIEELKLIDSVNACQSSSELIKLIKSDKCKNAAAGNGDDLIALSERYVNADFASAKIILMHRLLGGLVMTPGSLSDLSQKDATALFERVDAAKENMRLLYNHCISSGAYADERARVLEDEATGVQKKINEERPHALQLKAYRAALAEAGNAAVTTMYDTVEAVQKLDADAEIRARNIREAATDRQTRRQQLEELTASIEELAQRTELEQREEFKKNLIYQGRLRNGKTVEGWMLGRFSEQVEEYINKYLKDSDEDIIELAVIGYNERTRENMECVQAYLNDRLLGGGDFEYLKNPALRAMAERDLLEACGEDIFTAGSKSKMTERLSKLRAKKVFKGYSTAVAKMLAGIRKEKVLAPYAEAIMVNEKYLEAVRSKDAGKISEILSSFKKNVAAGESLIASKIGDFTYEQRLVLMENIKAGLGKQLLTASLETVSNIIQREVDYQNLLNPVADSKRAAVIKRAKELYAKPEPAMLEAINSAVQKARAQAQEADEEDHYESDADYLEYQVIHSVGVSLLFSTPDEINKYCLEKLSYYIASTGKTSSLEAKVMQFLREYTEERHFSYTESDIKSANAGELSAAEQMLVRELFRESEARKMTNGAIVSAGLKDLLYGMSVRVISMVKSLTPYLCEKKLVESDSFDSLTAGEVRELADFALERLAPLKKAIEKNKYWSGSDEIKTAMLERCLDTSRELATVGELTVIGENEHARLADAREIRQARKYVMSLGRSWTSKKVSVDLVNRRLNTAKDEKQFRDLNRIGRARNLAHEMTKFCETHSCSAPMSIYEFGDLEANRELSEEALFEKWKNEAILGPKGWVGGEANKPLRKAKEDFYHNKLHEKQLVHNLRLYSYYGMFDNFSVILKGLGESINDDSRENFEAKLFAVGRTYQRRKRYFEEICREYHLGREEINALMPNVSESFTDAPETIQRQSEEQRDAACKDYLRRVVSISSRYASGITVYEKRGAQLEADERLRAVSRRKDERIGRLSLAQNGIFAPIIPVLIENDSYQDAVLTYTDEAYRQYELKLMKKLEAPMQLLSSEGTVYNAFIDQFIIRFKAELIGDKMNPAESWTETFNKYYREITDHNYGTEAKPLSISTIIYDASMKAAKASARKKDTDLDSANMVIHVLLNEGASGVLDKAVFEKYRENLKTNSKVLNEMLEDFYKSDSFKHYIEQGRLHQKMGYQFDGKPEVLLKNIFTRGVRMAEREFLVKETALDYREHVSYRLRDMLATSLETLNVAANVTRITRNADELMDSTVVETKREGRRMMRAERAALSEYENLSELRVSPAMAAHMGKTVKVTARTAHSVENFQKTMTEKLAGAGDTKALAIEIASAYVARGQKVSLEQLQVFNANLESLMSQLPVRTEHSRRILLMRLTGRMGDPFTEWSQESIASAVDQLKSDKKVSSSYHKLIKLESELPKDGCLDSYYRSVRIAATYIAADGGDSEAVDKLQNMYKLLAKRILMLNVISDFITKNEDSLITVKTEEFKARDRLALRAGLFDYFAPEICNPDVKYDEAQIRIRMSELFADCMNNRQLQAYLVNDTGRCASIGSDQTVAEQGDSEYGSAVARGRLEQRLRGFVEDKNCGEYVKQYFMLAPEERTLFAHMAASHAVNSAADMSMSFGMAYGTGKTSGEADSRTVREYVDTRIITAPADYLRAERALFLGKQPDVDRLRLLLVAVKARHKEMLKQNVDMELLANSSAESRAVLGRSAINKVSSIQAFKAEVRSLSASDSFENQALVDRLVKLRPYELQMMAMILSDRTAVDIGIDSTEPVNAERAELLKRSLRTDAAGTLGSVRAGGELMNKALASLCSYRIKEDRVIIGPVTRDDLMDTERETAIDYALLRGAFEIMDKNHPESLINSALRYSYTEVKTGVIERTGSRDTRLAAYSAALRDITEPSRLIEYLAREAKGEIADSVKSLSSEEQKLFLYLLANRSAVDESKRFEGRVADQDTRDRVTQEYIANGTIAADRETFEDALAGLFSRQMDDAKIASDLKADVTGAFTDKTRTTAVDYMLVAKALMAVRDITDMRRVHEQNRRDSIFG